MAGITKEAKKQAAWLKEKCESETSHLQVMIDDIETQLSLNRNQTTQKGMTLMEQISDMTSILTQLENKLDDQGTQMDKDKTHFPSSLEIFLVAIKYQK